MLTRKEYINIMTEFNNKYVPSTPKTYEVRYVEYKKPSTLSKVAPYLGIKTVEAGF